MSKVGGDAGRRIPAWVEWVLTIAVGVGIALLVRAFVAEPFLIPSASMVPTIQEGDRVLGEKITYKGSSPQRGDVVTFVDPTDGSTTLIKRVVAVGGQTVDLRDGVVYVDDEALDEPYTHGKPSYPLDRYASTLQGPIVYPYTVPEGCVWVMGDNRTNSLDSRYFGAVPISSVSSKACVIFWPPDDFATL